MKNKYLLLLSSVFSDLLAAIFPLVVAIKSVGDLFFAYGKDFFYFTLFVWGGLLVLSFYFFRIYSVLWRFSTIYDSLRVFVASAVAVCATFISQMAVFNKSYGFNVVFVCYLLTCAFTLVFRFFVRVVLIKKGEETGQNAISASTLSGNIMIIGAGSAASMIINELARNGQLNNCKIKCAIDEDPAKKGTYISGVHIVGNRDLIVESAEKYHINTILFAIPSCNNMQKYEILNICQQTGCTLKIIPSIYQMMDSSENGLSQKLERLKSKTY